jgi:hypothetical protein
MTLLIGSLTMGMILALLAFGVLISFRILAFRDLTVDGSIALGGSVAAALIVSGVSPLAATAIAAVCGGIAGAVTGHPGNSLSHQRTAGRNSGDDGFVFGQPASHGPQQYPVDESKDRAESHSGVGRCDDDRLNLGLWTAQTQDLYTLIMIVFATIAVAVTLDSVFSNSAGSGHASRR